MDGDCNVVMKLRVGSATLDLQYPQVMGILNVTPDSFSDGNEFSDSAKAVQHAVSMAAQGATIIDVGGESTRPGAKEISDQEELDRVLPVIEAIAQRVEVIISIDTRRPPVMTAAASAGASMINDVFALRMDGALEAAAGTGCAICLMHMQGEPRTMQQKPEYDDVVEEVGNFLSDRISACVEAGIKAESLLVDPGFGFGKDDSHNITLLAKLDVLQELGRPILVGLSRKRTLGHLTGRAVGERGASSLAAAVLAYLHGASVIRSHDVAATVDALKIAAAVREAGSTKHAPRSNLGND